jgi:hypothetical protein
MPKTIKVIFIVIYTLIFSLTQGCKNKNHNENNNLAELTFKVNQSLLGKKYVDKYLGFSFLPPKSCLQMAEVTVQKVKDQLKKEYTNTNSYVIEPHQFFLNKNDKFACLVSILTTFSNVDSTISKYQKVIIAESKNSQVTQAIFLHNGFRIYQSLIISTDIIHFKLVVPQSSNKTFQVDYVIPKTIYQDELEAIESSIGSFLKL